MSKPEPVRMTDDDVLVLRMYGPDTEEGRAALARLARRLADWIDAQIAGQVYGEIDKKIKENGTLPRAGNK